MKKSEAPINLHFSYPYPIQAVWEALTVHEKMLGWYFDNIPDFQAKVGFQTQFVVHNEGRTFTHLWEITEVNPPLKISYSWVYAEYEGKSTVSFLLSPLKSGTALEVLMQVQEDFPGGIPEFDRQSGVDGWTYLLDQSLRAYLA